MERGQKLFGVVVTPTAHVGAKHTNTVFVLQDNGHHHLFSVLKEAFTLAPEAIEQSFEGNEFDIVADIKNQVRRREKRLEVGDWISWFYSGTDEISEFRREHKLHEMRLGNPHYQFLLECVKSPTEMTVYNSTFGWITISPEEARRLLPDVAFKAWIDVYIDESSGKEKLVVAFRSYVTTDHQMQIKVIDAPWTEYHKVDMRGFTEEDELEYLIVKVNEDKSKRNNEYKKFGYYISERSMYVQDTPDKFYVIPYINEEELIPGVQYKFDAFWNERMSVFIITWYEKMVDMEVLQTSGEARDKIMVLDSVSQRVDIKTMFHCSKNNYGLMDDPTGVLATHHLSRYAESRCRIFFYEDVLVSFGRFRIEKIEVDKAQKIEKNVKEGVNVINGVKGVVISLDGRVFSSLHSTLRIFLPEGKQYPIGTQVVFNAKFNHDTKELVAIDDANMKVLPGATEPIEYFEYNGRLLFKTEATWTPRSDIICGVVSDQFSLLDDPLRLLPRSESGKMAPKVNVWVCESGTNEGGRRRIAQTPFFIAAVKNSQPVFTSPKFVDTHGRDVAGWIKSRDGTLHAMAMELPTEVKPLAGKISKPSRAPPSATPRPSSCLPFPSSSSSISVPPVSSIPSIPSTPHPPLPFDCGCARGKCVAKKLIIGLMNDPKFRKILPEDLLDEVVDCIF